MTGWAKRLDSPCTPASRYGRMGARSLNGCSGTSVASDHGAAPIADAERERSLPVEDAKPQRHDARHLRAARQVNSRIRRCLSCCPRFSWEMCVNVFSERPSMCPTAQTDFKQSVIYTYLPRRKPGLCLCGISVFSCLFDERGSSRMNQYAHKKCRRRLRQSGCHRRSEPPESVA